MRPAIVFPALQFVMDHLMSGIAGVPFVDVLACESEASVVVLCFLCHLFTPLGEWDVNLNDLRESL